MQILCLALNITKKTSIISFQKMLNVITKLSIFRDTLFFHLKFDFSQLIDYKIITV